MSKISILQDIIASQIAAGEVVERPASAIKELIENSLDAHATNIEISVSKDCLDFTIIDDGYGMDGNDCVLAFAKHATSKIVGFEDLTNIATFGFRGEALNSIASVAKIKMQSKTKNCQIGTQVEIENNNIITKQLNCNIGTKIEVQELFFNVPARQKFLKKPKTEFSYIQDITESIALANNHIKFTLVYDNVKIFQTQGSHNIIQTAQEIGFLHSSHKNEFIEINNFDEHFKINGVISSPKIFKSDKKSIISIVNNRVVKCPVFLRVLDNLYKDLIPRQRYPIAILLLSMPPSLVDVNIHPTKKEVRYADSVLIYQFLYQNLKKCLNQKVNSLFNITFDNNQINQNYSQFQNNSNSTINEPINQLSFSSNSANSNTVFDNTNLTTDNSFNPDKNSLFNNYNSYKPLSLMSSALRPIETDQDTDLIQSLPWDFKLVGYINNTYFLIETKEGLLIVEQHIAHERINYETLLKNSKSDKTTNQQNLALQLALNLSFEQAECITKHKLELENCGYTFSQKDSQYFLNSIPITCTIEQAENQLHSIIDDILNHGAIDLNHNVLKSIACQSAIKNGMHLNNIQIIDLLTKWYHCPSNDTCPHGRPIALSFTYNKLFNLFHPK